MENRGKLEIHPIHQISQGKIFQFVHTSQEPPTSIFLTYHSLTPISEISEKNMKIPSFNDFQAFPLTFQISLTLFLGYFKNFSLLINSLLIKG